MYQLQLMLEQDTYPIDMLKYIYKHLNIQMHLPVYMCLFSSHILIFMVTGRYFFRSLLALRKRGGQV